MPPRKKTLTTCETTLPLVSEIKKSSEDKKQITTLENLKTQVNGEINHLVDLLIADINALESAKKQWQEEQALKERLQKQQQEEQNFQDALDKKKRQAEFAEKMETDKKKWAEEKHQQEEAIRVKKENWDAKEKEFDSLKSQTIDFPKQLEKAVTEAQKQISDVLKKDFDVEKKLLVQKYESDLKLLQQQISSLQIQLKQLEKDNASFKEEKNRAGEQMKEMAVAMVRGKEQNTSSEPQ